MNPFSHITTLFLGIFCCLSSAFSLQNVNNEEDTARVNFYINQAKASMGINFDSAVFYFKKAINLGEKLGYEEGLLRAYGPLGYTYESAGVFDQALTYYRKSLNLKRNLADTTGMIITYEAIALSYEYQGILDSSFFYFNETLRLRIAQKNAIGVSYTYYRIGMLNMRQGKYGEALDDFNLALSINASTDDRDTKGLILNSIGLVHSNQENFTNALDYYTQALEIFSETDQKAYLAMVLNNIGLVYEARNDPHSAKHYFERSLTIKKEIVDNHGLAYSLNHLGNVYIDFANLSEPESTVWNHYLDTALTYFNEALNIRETINDLRGQSLSLSSIARINLYKGNYQQAEAHAEKAYAIANAIEFINETQSSAHLLSEIYEKESKYDLALKYYKKNVELNDSISSKAAIQAAANLQAKHDYEKEKLISDANYQNLLNVSAEKRERQRLITWFISITSVLLLVALIVFIRRLKITRNQKRIIETQKQEVDKAYELLGQKNQEVLDSISYAKQIQTAILPPQSFIQKHLKHSFIFYQPKDIVAGDFYWIYPTENEVLFAVADCTGHGVPGAMVSVVCNSALNRSVREYQLNRPGAILDQTRTFILEEFREENKKVKDGMDIALCALSNRKIQFSGAHNPLWIVRKGELIELKADKQPIGKFDFATPFTTHNYNLEEGDMLYLFSDGFVDQFGGERGKKFKKSNFRKLLLAISDLPVTAQHEKIMSAFENWKKDYEQLDDVCVMGVRIV